MTSQTLARTNDPSFCRFVTMALLMILAVGFHELGAHAPLLYLVGVGVAKLMVTGLLGGCASLCVLLVTDAVSECRPDGWVANHQFEVGFTAFVATTFYLCFSHRVGIPLPL